MGKIQIRGDVKRVPISEVSPNPWNYNRQSNDMYEKEKLSIHKNGFIEPIHVRQLDVGYQIIDGEHRWRACKDLNFDEISVIDLGVVPHWEAEGLTIILNDLHGSLDEVKLSKALNFMATLPEWEDYKEQLPWDDKEVARLCKLTNFSWEQLKPSDADTPKVSEGGGPGPVSVQTYAILLEADLLEHFANIVKWIQTETNSTEGRALELMCADYLSGHG